jgi:hypothetical protein
VITLAILSVTRGKERCALSYYPAIAMNASERNATHSSKCDYFPHCFRSTRSLTFAAAVVCHCMFSGKSSPPQASGLM